MNSTRRRVVFFLFALLLGSQAEAQVKGVLLNRRMLAWLVARHETGVGINYQKCSYRDRKTGHVYSYQDIDFNHMPAGKYYMEIPEYLLRKDRLTGGLHPGDYRIILSQRQEVRPTASNPGIYYIYIPSRPPVYFAPVSLVAPWLPISYECAKWLMIFVILLALVVVILEIRRFVRKTLARLQTLEEEVKRLRRRVAIKRPAFVPRIAFPKLGGTFRALRLLSKRISISSLKLPKANRPWIHFLFYIPRAFSRIHCAPNLFKKWQPSEVPYLASKLAEGFNRTLPRSRRTVRAVPRYNPLTHKATVLVYGDERYPNMGPNAGDVADVVSSVSSDRFELMETLPAKIGFRRREGVEVVYRRK